jgi:hypothetical protein
LQAGPQLTIGASDLQRQYGLLTRLEVSLEAESVGEQASEHRLGIRVEPSSRRIERIRRSGVDVVPRFSDPLWPVE